MFVELIQSYISYSFFNPSIPIHIMSSIVLCATWLKRYCGGVCWGLMREYVEIIGVGCIIMGKFRVFRRLMLSFMVWELGLLCLWLLYCHLAFIIIFLCIFPLLFRLFLLLLYNKSDTNLYNIIFPSNISHLYLYFQYLLFDISNSETYHIFISNYYQIWGLWIPDQKQ